LLILIFLALVLAVVFTIETYSAYKDIKNGSIPENLQGLSEGNFFNPDLSNLRNILETLDDPSLGSPNAPITIVEFGDFECPFCRESFTIIRELESLYKGRIRLIYRDFPIVDIHKNSLLAHVAANCANEQGKFWAMHDKIFANQDDMLEADLKKYARQIGLDENKFNSCLSSNKYNKEIVEDLNNGVKLGVGRTPTWFMNGYKIEGSITLDQWKDLVEKIPVGK